MRINSAVSFFPSSPFLRVAGLGTSSILAGALLAALGIACGLRYDTDSLIHAVLYLEQVLTTGGGWQDQVGGLLPGAKLSTSQKGLPLKVFGFFVPFFLFDSN